MRGREVLVVGCLLVAACHRGPSMALRTASAEFVDCPAQHLSVEDVEPDRYRVQGCGRTQIYQCERGVGCWREGWFANRAIERAAKAFSCERSRVEVHWLQDETYRVRGCGHEDVYACGHNSCSPERSSALDSLP
jgi:hypothetical protein